MFWNYSIQSLKKIQNFQITGLLSHKPLTGDFIGG